MIRRFFLADNLVDAAYPGGGQTRQLLGVPEQWQRICYSDLILWCLEELCRPCVIWAAS
jgi:hypothetical protein